MIIDFKYSKKTHIATWRFKGFDKKVKFKGAKIVRPYEFLEKVFVITVENNTSVLYVYDAEGNVYDKIVSTKDFFIAGIRGGMLDVEVLVKSENKPPCIYIYKAKKKSFINTGEIIESKSEAV